MRLFCSATAFVVLSNSQNQIIAVICETTASNQGSAQQLNACARGRGRTRRVTHQAQRLKNPESASVKQNKCGHAKINLRRTQRKRAQALLPVPCDVSLPTPALTRLWPCAFFISSCWLVTATLATTANLSCLQGVWQAVQFGRFCQGGHDQPALQE